MTRLPGYRAAAGVMGGAAGLLTLAAPAVRRDAADDHAPTTGGPPTTRIEPGSGPATPPGTLPGGGPGGSPPGSTADPVPSQGAPGTPASITPAAATSATGTLPDTGSDALPLVAAGLVLAGLGSGIVLVARARR